MVNLPSLKALQLLNPNQNSSSTKGKSKPRLLGTARDFSALVQKLGLLQSKSDAPGWNSILGRVFFPSRDKGLVWQRRKYYTCSDFWRSPAWVHWWGTPDPGRGDRAAAIGAACETNSTTPVAKILWKCFRIAGIVAGWKMNQHKS